MSQKQLLINNLFKLTALLENSGDFIFTPIGLTVKTYTVLSLISTGIDTSRDLLAGTYGTKPNMTKKLKFLEEHGFIVRQIDPHDKRVFRFTLTEKSHQSLKKIGPVYEKAIACIFDGISVSDIHTVTGVLEECIKNLHNPSQKTK